MRISDPKPGFSIDPPPKSPYFGLTSRERVAQPVEHLTFNQRVLGSSPSALTTSFSKGHRHLSFELLFLITSSGA